VVVQLQRLRRVASQRERRQRKRQMQRQAEGEEEQAKARQGRAVLAGGEAALQATLLRSMQERCCCFVLSADEE
jgi:hypothetical protein